MESKTHDIDSGISSGDSVSAIERAVNSAIEDVERIGVKTRCAENVYIRAFEKSAQKLTVDPLITRSPTLKEKASRRFEAEKDAFFEEIEAYRSALDRYLKEVEGYFDTLNAMTASLLISNETFDVLSERLATLHHLCNEAKESIERSKKSIEKHTV